MSSLSHVTNCSFNTTMDPFLHPEHSKRRIGHWCIERGRNTQGQHGTCITWVDNAIIPEASSAMVGIPFLLILIENGLFEGSLFLLTHMFASRLQPLFAHGCQYIGSLFSTHH